MKSIRSILLFLPAWCMFPVILHAQLPDPYREVDQVLWVVSDLEGTIAQYAELGFGQVQPSGPLRVRAGSDGESSTVLLARANLAGAMVTWIETLKGDSPFTDYHRRHGDGAMALVHRFSGRSQLSAETDRLGRLGIGILEVVTFELDDGPFSVTLLDTEKEGKYVLGFTSGEEHGYAAGSLTGENRHGMVLNQYAFAIRDPEPVSAYWHRIGLPEFRINHPELGHTHYYGEIVDHQLIQGWQRHGTVAYEWCIPVKTPIVYEDHIRKHGEGIHHLAFTVEEMDPVLEDFTSRGFTVSMGGTWGEAGKPGSGRYEYIDMEEAGGLTIELLWSYK